jgi:hypothetical protein
MNDKHTITYNKERKTVQVDGGISFAPLAYLKGADGRLFKLDWDKEEYVPVDEPMDKDEQ